MRQNHTLQLLRSGQPALGAWLQLVSPNATRLLAAQGCFDWLVVDMEHSPIDVPTATVMLSTIADVSGGRITPLVRLLSGTQENIKQALDAGAQGVIAPLVGTAEEARRVVRFARYPPEGERGSGGLLPHIGFGASRAEYLTHANREILVGVQIETRQGLENVDAIAAVPGIDVLFIGPNDLHLALGLPAGYWSDEPAFTHAIERVRRACQGHGVTLGTLCQGAQQVKARRGDGFRFVGLGSDAYFLLTFVATQHDELRDDAEPRMG